MTKMACLYPDRDAVLVAYLYDDIDSAGLVAFDTHVTTCLACRSELAELRRVRTTLGQWAPPEPARTSLLDVESRIPNPGAQAWWHTIPVWAQVAAAMLVLGASASVANLDVRYDHNGLSVRTGWSRPVAAPAQTAPATADAAPWRAELSALQTQLRSEMRQALQSPVVTAASATPAGTTMPDAEFRRRARVLIDESEKRQQNELAFRLVEFQRDLTAQRQADLTKINQNIGFIQRDTYGELLKQREGVNYLLKVSQTR